MKRRYKEEAKKIFCNNKKEKVQNASDADADTEEEIVTLIGK